MMSNDDVVNDRATYIDTELVYYEIYGLSMTVVITLNPGDKSMN